jgi:putative pyruvate formate lyase activating enzyme
MKRTQSYQALYASGELERRAVVLERMLTRCTLCPHDCGNDRTQGAIARCYSGSLPIVSSYCLHFGEEPALAGTRGVGNVFFGNCNLKCVYCQNFQISQNWKAERANEVTHERLAGMMLELQAQGASAIGFVSPTHFTPQIVRALTLAVPLGLELPLVYNTNAYDSVDVLRLLEGIIDIYLPDLKYGDDAFGLRFSKVKSYAPVSRAAVLEMFRQTGSALEYDDDKKLVRRGLIIRHLVLPNDIASSAETLKWIHDTMGATVTLSIMSQYFPAHDARHMELLNRAIREREYERVLGLLDRFGFENGWIQEFDSRNYYRPDFAERSHPFKNIPDCTSTRSH